MVVEEAINRKFTKVAISTTRPTTACRAATICRGRSKEAGRQAAGRRHREVQHRGQGHDRALLRAKSGGAEAILIWAIGPELARGERTARWHDRAFDRRLDALDVEHSSTTGQERQRRLIRSVHRGPDHAKAKAFIEAYHKAYGVNRIPSESRQRGIRRRLHLRRGGEAGGARTRTRIKDAPRTSRSGPRRDRRLEASLHRWTEQNVETTSVPREHCVMGMVQDGKVNLRAREDRPAPGRAGQGSLTRTAGEGGP